MRTFKCYLHTCSSLRLKSRVALVVRRSTSTPPIPLDVTSKEPLLGGYVGVRARERPCRRTLRAPNTHQRGRKRSTRELGLHHWRSPKFTAVGYPGNADRSYRPSTANAKFSKTHSAAVTTTTGILSLCSLWFSSRCLHWKYRSWSHDAHGSEARRSTPASRKCGQASTERSRSVCNMWCLSIAAGQALQPLQEGHRDSRHHSR